jgi:hypothetical protein
MWIVVVIILVLALLLFGGLFLLRWWLRKKNSQRIIGDVGSGSTQAVSKADRKAELDSLLQRFRTGLKEFDRAGYSVYDYPWFVVIGESGAGKTEAVRSALEDQVPATVRHHIPPKGGTKDFVWWFTKHGIVLDTAGSLIHPEPGAKGVKDEAWRLFLTSLRKSRPRCPINGLIVALSADSLIKSTSEKIASNAKELSDKIEMIQTELDVRFPVYLLVTKCDLLTGFREFTERIEDPQLQHQIFGWSNPAPLDEPFRPDSIHSCLTEVAEQVRRRRLAMLRPAEGGRLGDTAMFRLGQAPGVQRRMDEVDSLFALPESLMRLESRLKRYLETIFVAGEWSSKPVFLRGIYFTSAMREGAALDEAIAALTGTAISQATDDRMIDSNKGYFLRDIFVEKVANEKGLVTRAKNTLQVLRQRQLAIYGSATVALILFLAFAWFGYRGLDKSVRAEARYWHVASTNWSGDEWTPPIVKTKEGPGYHFAYAGDDAIASLDGTTIAGFHRRLRELAGTNLPVSFVFKPVTWISGGPNKHRPDAQRAVFEGGVLKPLYNRARDKMQGGELKLNDAAAVRRHQDALVELIRLEAEGLSPTAMTSARAEGCIHVLVSYLVETNAASETNLAQTLAWDYREKGMWPPKDLPHGGGLADNKAIDVGLRSLQQANAAALAPVTADFTNLQALVQSISDYSISELAWLSAPKCEMQDLASKYRTTRGLWSALGRDGSLKGRFFTIRTNLSVASASPVSHEVQKMLQQLPPALQSRSLIKDVSDLLAASGKEVLAPADGWFASQTRLPEFDANFVAGSPDNSLLDQRWTLYTNACVLSQGQGAAALADVGSAWSKYIAITAVATAYTKNLAAYAGQPQASAVSNACTAIAGKAVKRLQEDYVSSYNSVVKSELSRLSASVDFSQQYLTNTRTFLSSVTTDLSATNKLAIEDQVKLIELPAAADRARSVIMDTVGRIFRGKQAFPIRLGADSNAAAMKIEDLALMRVLADVVRSEMRNPVWGQAADPLLRDCDRVAPVLNMLLTTNGLPTQWDLIFIPPAPNSSDSVAPAVFRVLDGSGQIWDLSRVDSANTTPFASLASNGDLNLFFKKHQQDTTGFKWGFRDWWLARVMVSGWKDESRGESWRFKVSVQDGTNFLGNLTFEARPKQAGMVFPKLADWKGESSQAAR